MVFIHGMACSGLQWRGTLAALATDYTAMAVDLPGFGLSKQLAPAFPELADAVVEGARAHGHHQFAVVGHSFGGLVAQDLAARYREAVTGLVLVASLGGAHRERMGLGRRISRMPWVSPVVLWVVRTLAWQRVLEHAVYRRDALPDGVVHELLWSARHARAMRHGGALVPGSPPVLSLSRSPLLIWGEHDRVVPLAQGMDLLRRTGGRLEVIPGCGHLPMLEAPDAFHQLLRDYLSGNPGPSWTGGPASPGVSQ
ncbi:MAG: alpha/beta hydrolase [Bacillota bacterium]